MDNDYVKSKAPIFIISFCAGFMMLIQTIASGLAVVGYDDVIRADAKARESQILQGVNSGKELKDSLILLQEQVNSLNLDIELLEHEVDSLKLLSHEPAS